MCADIENVVAESHACVSGSSSPWGSSGMRVLNEPQLSAHPCRQSTGRPCSGPHTVPRISPQGTATRTSDSTQTNKQTSQPTQHFSWLQSLTHLEKNDLKPQLQSRGSASQIASLPTACVCKVQTAPTANKPTQPSVARNLLLKLFLFGSLFVTLSVH